MTQKRDVIRRLMAGASIEAVGGDPIEVSMSGIFGGRPSFNKEYVPGQRGPLLLDGVPLTDEELAKIAEWFREPR